MNVKVWEKFSKQLNESLNASDIEIHIESLKVVVSKLL